ncbi:MAG: hypothetical protein AAF734_04935 [Bacteroidota bacterium]
MLPKETHTTDWHHQPNNADEELNNFVEDRSIFLGEVNNYYIYRSLLYALGATGAYNRMMKEVNLIIHGKATKPAKAVKKYPDGEFLHIEKVLPLVHQEIHSFPSFIQALKKQDFTVRNPSDEGDPQFDFFDLSLENNSLHETLLKYIQTSPFVLDYIGESTPDMGTKEDNYINFENQEVRGWYKWVTNAWSRVYAQRGEGDYPLEIKGNDLLAVAPIFWTESTGLYVHEYPHIDSVNGLFIQAGIDARTGKVNGVAISRVWT